MTRKHKRMLFLAFGLAGLGAASAFALSAFQDNLVFFYAPSDVVAKHVPQGRRFRLGGLVEEHSVVRQPDGVSIAFTVTDLKTTMPVTFTGVVPDLFREGQGVVAEGAIGADGVFHAREVLARHDETYMPPEVAKALKASGQWREDQPGQGSSQGPGRGSKQAGK